MLAVALWHHILSLYEHELFLGCCKEVTSRKFVRYTYLLVACGGLGGLVAPLSYAAADCYVVVG